MTATLDLAHIEALAKAASEGPWRHGQHFGRCVMKHRHGEGNCDYTAGDWRDGGRVVSDDRGRVIAEYDADREFGLSDDNAAYIAAVSPDVALALIARVREMEALERDYELDTLVPRLETLCRAEAWGTLDRILDAVDPAAHHPEIVVAYLTVTISVKHKLKRRQALVDRARPVLRAVETQKGYDDLFACLDAPSEGETP